MDVTSVFPAFLGTHGSKGRSWRRNWKRWSRCVLSPASRTTLHGSCWWFRNPVNSPVEVGSWSHYLQGFIHPKGGSLAGFLSLVSGRGKNRNDDLSSSNFCVTTQFAFQTIVWKMPAALIRLANIWLVLLLWMCLNQWGPIRISKCSIIWGSMGFIHEMSKSIESNRCFCLRFCTSETWFFSDISGKDETWNSLL